MGKMAERLAQAHAQIPRFSRTASGLIGQGFPKQQGPCNTSVRTPPGYIPANMRRTEDRTSPNLDELMSKVVTRTDLE
jgi:hypothetical protein